MLLVDLLSCPHVALCLLRLTVHVVHRFRWRRRLFVMSSPNDEEWAYQQQLYTLTTQACNMGELHVREMLFIGPFIEHCKVKCARLAVF